MNLFAAATLAIAVLQLSLGCVLWAVSRAPEWRGVWPSALITLSAGAFSLVNVAFVTPGVADSTVALAMRLNFLIASIHLASWLTYAYAGKKGDITNLPHPVRIAVVGTLISGTVLCLTGWHLVPNEFTTLTIEATGVQYRLSVTSPAGMLFSAWCLIVLAAALWQFRRRRLREGKSVFGFTIGMTVFFLSALDEVLVSIGLLRFYSLADVGFLALIVPVASDILRRFVDDSRRLRELTTRLTGEVAERTSERDRAQVALVESERHAVLGHLAAGVGHEINNPLTYLSLNLELLEQWLVHAAPPADVAEAVTGARDASHRIGRVLDELRSATRISSGRHVVLDPIAVCESALRVAGPQVRRVTEVTRSFDEVPLVTGDEAKLVQVIVNLLTNAANAITDTADGRVPQLTVRTATSPDGAAVISVSDNGMGITPADLERVTEPYFTTRHAAGGTGLGLYLSKEMAEQHGGALAVTSTVNHGTTVQLTLPSAMPEHETMPVVAQQAPTPHFVPTRVVPSRYTVMVIDDEPFVLKVLSRALQDEFHVLTFTSGQEALHAIDAGVLPDVIVCDVMMPGVDGIAVRARLTEQHHPAAERMLFVTGGAVSQAAHAFVRRDDVRVLYKPLSAVELRDAVNAVLTAKTASERSPDRRRSPEIGNVPPRGAPSATLPTQLV
jgi:signal transduction histidine kinase/CheY-like chemotaxis protein